MSAVTIPGALADHLTTEPPLDLDTRTALDAARRGRGRTLLIELKTIAPLHVISRRAEYLLGDAYATRAQKDAARVWLKRAGRAPQIITLRFEDTETAYNASQCCTEIHTGDVLVVEAEQAVAFMWQAWPCAVTAAHGEFHRAEGDPREIEANTGPSVRAAIDAAYAIGAPLARLADQVEAEEAIAQAAAADAPEAMPTVQAARAAQPVVIIPCGAAKLDREAPAAELYTGSYHRACARAAATLTANGGTVLIMSALHGLVPLDRVLTPYEMRMGVPGCVTPDVLREQARELGLDRATNVTILAGLSYTVPALAVWPHAGTPLAGLPGMGHHMRALAAIASGEQSPATKSGPELYAPRGMGNLTTGHMLDEATGRAYCGIELADLNGAAILTCAACRHHRNNQTAPEAAGTWRAEWIGAAAEGALFTLDTSAGEQGALFAA